MLLSPSNVRKEKLTYTVGTRELNLFQIRRRRQSLSSAARIFEVVWAGAKKEESKMEITFLNLKKGFWKSARLLVTRVGVCKRSRSEPYLT
jgi:hypothetical protein